MDMGQKKKGTGCNGALQALQDRISRCIANTAPDYRGQK